MKYWRSVVLGLGLFGVLVVGGGRASAAGQQKVFTYRGAGWTLAVSGLKAPYSKITLRGTLSHAGQQYHVEGDWIPAGDAGGYLLRFYGHPFQSSGFKGLVGVATLYNTCTPNCAAGRTYKLMGAMGWLLPGSKLHSVKLVVG